MPAALWSVQMTVYVPFLVNLWLTLPLAVVFDLKPLPTTLCGTLPFHAHFTVVPCLILRLWVAFPPTAKASPFTPTFLVAGSATADRASAAVRATTTNRETSFLTEAP